METYIDKVVDAVAKRSGIYNKQLIRYYALLVLIKGEKVTAADVHDGWAMSMNFREKNDHCWGHDHYSLVPFDELSEETQHKDDRFVKELQTIARDLMKATEGEEQDFLFSDDDFDERFDTRGRGGF